MFFLIKTTLKIYLTNFWFYFKIVSPILFPLLTLPIIAHYSYFGKLTVIFSTTLGLSLTILLFFVDIILIRSSYHHLTEPQGKLSFREEYKTASAFFIRYIGLLLATGFITGSVPILTQILLNYTSNRLLIALLKIVNTSWMAACVFLFLLSFYVLIIENDSIGRALKKGVALFLNNPFLFTVKLIGASLFFGLLLVILSSITTIGIALITGQTDIVLNSELASVYSPWWQQIIISAYAFLGMPLLVIATSILFHEIKTQEGETSPQTSNFRLKPL